MNSTQRSPKKYALFGGTFDPFTPAHKAIVEALVNKQDENGNAFFDEIWIAPTVVSYHRQSKMHWLDDKQKLRVIEAMLATVNNGHMTCHMPEVSIWANDIKRKAMCKTSDELREFAESRRFIHTLYDFKASMCRDIDEVYVVIGPDSYNNFKTWHMWSSILAQAKLLVVVGRNTPLEDNGIPFFEMMTIDSSFDDMSGSLMRELYADRGVEEYIKMIESGTVNDKLLLSTPIFEVFKGKPVPALNGLEPIRVKAPDWVTVIVEKDDEFIVVSQMRAGTMEEVSEFPCGVVELDESLTGAAARELREEVGLKVPAEELQYLGSMSPNPAFMTNHMHVFYFNMNEASGSVEWTGQKLDEHENIGWAWRSKKAFIEQTFRDTKMWANNSVPGMMLAAIAMYNNSGRETK